MAAQCNSAAPCLVDEVVSRANAAAVPPVPAQGLSNSASVTLAFPNGRFSPDDVKHLDEHASALLGAQFCSRFYKDFWNLASHAYFKLQSAQRRLSQFSIRMQSDGYLKTDLVMPTLYFSASLLDTDEGKKLKAVADKITLACAKELAIHVHGRGHELEVKAFTLDAQFHRLWATALLKTDGTLGAFTSLAEAKNLDQPAFTLASPIFGNDPAREALVKSHLLPGLRSTALSLRQQFEDFTIDRDRIQREKLEQARIAKEARDKHDTEALRDKGGSVAAIASNAAKAAAEPEISALKAENAANKEAIAQLQAQVAQLLQRQPSGSTTLIPASPRTPQSTRPPSPAARPNQVRRVAFDVQAPTPPTASPAVAPRSPATGTAPARPSPTPSLKPDAKKAAARKPRQTVTPASSSKPTAAHAAQPKVAKPAAAPATPQLPVVPSSAPPAHLLTAKNNKANSTKKGSGNGFAPLAHVHRATESEPERDEDDLLDTVDEDPPQQEAPPPLQPNAQRATRGGKTSRTRSQTSTGGSARGDSHH